MEEQSRLLFRRLLQEINADPTNPKPYQSALRMLNRLGIIRDVEIRGMPPEGAIYWKPSGLQYWHAWISWTGFSGEQLYYYFDALSEEGALREFSIWVTRDFFDDQALDVEDYEDDPLYQDVLNNLNTDKVITSFRKFIASLYELPLKGVSGGVFSKTMPY